MGYHFSHLLTLRQSLKAPEASMNNVVLRDMIYNSESIIALAMNTTDERTRHLTDHIYHMLVFAALTICQLVKTYEPHLAVSSLGLDVGSLAETVAQLISWLRHIGLPCHAAYMLGSIVEAEFNKTRHAFRRRDMGGAGGSVAVDGTSLAMPPGTDNVSFAPPNMDFTFLYPEFVSSGLFDTGSQAVWPQWS